MYTTRVAMTLESEWESVLKVGIRKPGDRGRHLMTITLLDFFP